MPAYSHVSEDKTTTFCVYDAPTMEAIRKTAAANGLSVPDHGARVLDRTSTRKEEQIDA